MDITAQSEDSSNHRNLIPMQTCKIELISLPEPYITGTESTGTGRTAGDSGMEATTDKMRLSFLEEESKYLRRRLNSFEKDTQMILAQLSLVTEWISATFVGADLIDTNSSFHKNWTKNTAQNLTQIAAISKSIRVRSNRRQGQMGNAMQDPAPNVFNSSRPKRACQRKGEQVQNICEENDSENDARDADYIPDFDQVLRVSTDFIKVEPGLPEEEEGSDIAGMLPLLLDDGDELGADEDNNSNDGDEESNNSYLAHFVTERHPLTQKIITNKCKHCSLEVYPRDTTMARHVTEKCAELNYAQISAQQPAHVWHKKTDDIWHHFEWRLKKPQNGKKDLRITNRYKTNKGKIDSNLFSLFCKTCHIRLMPRATRLRAHIKEECGQPKKKKARKPSSSCGRGRREDIWSHFEWGEKRFKGRKKKSDPQAQSEEAATSTAANPPNTEISSTNTESITSLKAKNLTSYCKHCHKKVSSKVASLARHLRACEVYKPDETKDLWLHAKQYQPRRARNNRMPKQCAECRRVVTGSMTRHLELHAEQSARKFACPSCPEWFRGKKSLDSHLQLIHQCGSLNLT